MDKSEKKNSHESDKHDRQDKHEKIDKSESIENKPNDEKPNHRYKKANLHLNLNEIEEENEDLNQTLDIKAVRYDFDDELNNSNNSLQLHMNIRRNLMESIGDKENKDVGESLRESRDSKDGKGNKGLRENTGKLQENKSPCKQVDVNNINNISGMNNMNSDLNSS